MRPLVLTTIATFLFFTVNAFAERDRGGLTPVERDKCVTFPKVTPAGQMKKDFHYTEESYCNDEDYLGNCQGWRHYLSFKYFYFENSTIEYYTADGKLVTTKNERSKRELGTTGETTTEGENRLVEEIEKAIFKSDDPVCADSFYK